MALIRLSEIGKIYSGNETLAVGLRKVSLEFDTGEFVAVTGQSGSGKTTLLNIIGGIDSYEEGELYINDSPTSHYTQKDWEKYREDYVSFIFQEYNVLESFTVLENVELSLPASYSGKSRRKRALDLISKVGLEDKIHCKCAKLSGGQKQRTVIARALAKDSPVILADEPTGNLDSGSAAGIVTLLKEISADKLVIMVTHDFESVRDTVTREVRIFDGSVEFDRRIRPASSAPENQDTDLKTASTGHFLRASASLGWALYRSKPIFTVFLALMMIFPVLGLFGLSLFVSQTLSSLSDSTLFTYIPGRLVVSTADGSPFSEEELSLIASESGADSYIFNDQILDYTFTYSHIDSRRDYYIRFSMTVSLDPPNDVDVGRLPENDKEVLLSVPISLREEFGADSVNDVDLNKYAGLSDMKVCGIDYYYDNTRKPKIHMTEEGLKNFTSYKMCEMTFDYITLDVLSSSVTGKNYNAYEIKYSDLLAKDEIYYVHIPQGEVVSVAFENGSDALLRYNFISKEPEGVSKTDFSALWVSTEFLPELTSDILKNGLTQSSLFFGSDSEAERAIPKLREYGFLCFMSDTERTSTDNLLTNALEIVGMAVLAFFLVLFLALFVILCTSRAVISTKGDIAVLRSAGIRSDILKAAFVFRMLLSVVPAYILLAVTAAVIYLNPTTNGLFVFLHAGEYLLIFFGMLAVVLIVTVHFVKRIFKVSVRKALKEGEAI